MEEKPVGGLFTHVYQDRGHPADDSIVLRNRLASYLGRNHVDELWGLFNYLAQETGYIQLAQHRKLTATFVELKIGEFLNVITLIWRFFAPRQFAPAYELPKAQKSTADWKRFVERVFIEENIGYRLDAKCGVHHVVDAEFQHNRASVLRSMDDPRYDAVRNAFDRAHAHLSPANLDPKAVIRSIFESLETLSRLMVGGKNLNKFCAENQLRNEARKVFGTDGTNIAAVDATFSAFGSWIEGIHLYRHGQAVEVPVDPSLEWTVYIVSSASTYLRLLIDIDKKTRAIA